MKKHLCLLLLMLFAALAIRTQLAFGSSAGITPDPVVDSDYYEDGAASPAKVELGRMLFFDKILSGNKNISCASCHHPSLGTSDGLALPLGEGPHGLGPERIADATLAGGVYERVPRNSPALFNLGAREFKRMFHDGRVEVDTEGYYEGGFITPAKWKLPTGLDNALAAQAMFPVTSPTEMAGQQGENAIADAKALNRVAGPGGVWDLLAQRLQGIPAYVEMFRKAYPDQVRSASEIDFVLAANAIAAFEAQAFRADNSPFDRYLRNEAPLSDSALRGMRLFYGKAACHSCHAGKFQTDHEFHAIAMPQIGPGKQDGWNSDYWRRTGHKAFPEDFGRGRVTKRAEDHYKFRTPSLRNVTQTGPWGHDGAFDELEAVVRHHLNPIDSLQRYDLPKDLLAPIDGILEIVASGAKLKRSWLAPSRLKGFMERDAWVQGSEELRARIAEANELKPMALTEEEVDDLLRFLEALTDTGAGLGEQGIPKTVPSGLPVAD